MISSKFGIGQQVVTGYPALWVSWWTLTLNFLSVSRKPKPPAMIFPEKRPGITW